MVKPTPSKRDVERNAKPRYVSLYNPVKFRKDYGNPKLTRQDLALWQDRIGIPVGKICKWVGMSRQTWWRLQNDAYIPEPWRSVFLGIMETFTDEDYQRIRRC